MRGNTSTAEKIESAVQILILLGVGATAGAASFRHVHDLAVVHGQPDWIGWADAVVSELLSVGAGLEMRRRKRAGRSQGFAVTVLVSAVVLSVSAQVAAAEWSVWGWVMAALPACGFLACVKIVLSRATVSEAFPQEKDCVTPSPTIETPESNQAPEAPLISTDREASEPPLISTESEEKSPQVNPVTPAPRRRSQSKSDGKAGKRTRRPIEESARIYREALEEDPQATPEDIMKKLGITTTRQLSNIRNAALAA